MIRLLLVQAVRLVSELMATTLKAEPDLQIVGSANTASEALLQLRQIPCDLVLIDINLPDNDAYRLLRDWTQNPLPGKVLMTGVVDSENIVLRCLEEGASGYVLEAEPWHQFMTKIRAVGRNEFIISPSMTTALITRIAELKQLAMQLNGFKAADLSLSTELTARELEVLKLIEQGFTNQEVAESLAIELGTVKNHVHNIFNKLGVGNRQYAAMYARQMLGEESLKSGQL